MAKYKPEYVDQAYVACSESGMTDVQLAKLFGVCKAAINQWKHKYPEFKKQVQAGRDEFDGKKGENSLQKRILGYYWTEVTKELDKNLDKLVVTKKVKKHVPADVSGLRYFLNNRRSSRWRNVKHVELTGEGGGPIETREMTNLERANRLCSLLAQAQQRESEDNDRGPTEK